MSGGSPNGVSDAYNPMDMNAAFSPDDRKAFDAYKRAVYRRPPPYFTVTVLPAIKHGGAFSYGLRICPQNSEYSDPKAPKSEYEIWRRWEDCLYLQETLEAEYQALLGVKNATSASEYSLGSDSASSIMVISAFSPTVLPPHAESDVHAYLPRLTKKGTIFRPSAATIEQREREFRLLIHSLFDPPDYAPVGVLRRVRPVHDFFGIWRRDHDRVQKYGGSASLLTEPTRPSVPPRKLSATRSVPASLSRTPGVTPVEPSSVSPVALNFGRLGHDPPPLGTHAILPAPRIRDLVTPPSTAQSTARSVKDLSKATPFLSLGVPPPTPTRPVIRGAISTPISPSSPSYLRSAQKREELSGLRPVPPPGALDMKIVSGDPFWQIVTPATERGGLPPPPGRTLRTVEISAPLSRAPSPVPSVISLSTSIFSEESDVTEYAGESTTEISTLGRADCAESQRSNNTFGKNGNTGVLPIHHGQQHTPPASRGSSAPSSGSSEPRPDSAGSDLSLLEIGALSLASVRQVNGPGHTSLTVPPRVVWLPPKSPRSPARPPAVRISGGPARGEPPSLPSPTLQDLLDADVHQRWWHTHSSVVSTSSGSASPSAVSTEFAQPRTIPRGAYPAQDIKAWARSVTDASQSPSTTLSRIIS